MATSRVKAPFLSGQTVYAKLFAVDGVTDTVLYTSPTGTEQTNDKGTYVFTFTDVAAGTYKLKLFYVSDNDVAAEVFCKFAGTDLEVVNAHDDPVLIALEASFPLVSGDDITAAILGLATAVQNNRTYGV
jgi:hypothetical protein